MFSLERCNTEEHNSFSVARSPRNPDLYLGVPSTFFGCVQHLQGRLSERFGLVQHRHLLLMVQNLGSDTNRC